MFYFSIKYSELVLEKSKNVFFQTEEQAEEVQAGLWLLNMAISSLGASITNSALHSHIDASIRNIASLKQVLRSLSIQVSPVVMRDKSGGHVGQLLFLCMGIRGRRKNAKKNFIRMNPEIAGG